MKKILCCLALVFVVFAIPVSAAETDSTQSQDDAMFQEYYEQQAEDSGANDLPNYLPDDTKSQLDQMGISGVDWNSIQSIQPNSVFSQILKMLGEGVQSPMKALLSLLGIMMLCALLNSMKINLGEKNMGGIMNLIGTLCICMVVITPIVQSIVKLTGVIQGASTFMLACIPVLVGIMISNGQTVTASSYNLLMLGTTNSISFLSAHFLAPCMNIFLGFSVVSAISPTLRLNTLCNTISKIVKWVLGFCMSVFTGLLTIQSLLGGSVDVTTNRTLRFVVSSFVPVVGSALGEALSTVQGCIKVLKGGVGAFGVLAVVFMFLPILIECLLWQMTLTVCAGIGDVFDLKEITSILNAASKVMSMMLAILLCTMAMMTISTVVVLMMGGAVQ
ncbi:MAG: stage III sporulation protein AE [Clostridium sp.]|nr:stage III sporulation protein AE [Clostridium sp.]